MNTAAAVAHNPPNRIDLLKLAETAHQLKALAECVEELMGSSEEDRAARWRAHWLMEIIIRLASDNADSLDRLGAPQAHKASIEPAAEPSASVAVSERMRAVVSRNDQTGGVVLLFLGTPGTIDVNLSLDSAAARELAMQLTAAAGGEAPSARADAVDLAESYADDLDDIATGLRRLRPVPASGQ